jgi:hypothetical protein
MIFILAEPEAGMDKRPSFECFMEGAEGYGGVPYGGFVMCCLEEVLPEIALVGKA